MVGIEVRPAVGQDDEVHGRRRLLLVGVLWAAVTAFGLAFAALTAIGPIVLTLSRTHGVHAGDLAAFVVAYALAGGGTLRLLRSRRGRATRQHGGAR